MIDFLATHNNHGDFTRGLYQKGDYKRYIWSYIKDTNESMKKYNIKEAITEVIRNCKVLFNKRNKNKMIIA